MPPDSTRRWLKHKQARLIAKWRLFTKRNRDVNHPTYIAQYQRYQEEARRLNFTLSRSGRNTLVRKFTHRWTFTGTMTTCIHCNATRWYDEKVRGGRNHEPRFRICCHFGQVRLTPLPTPPPLLIVIELLWRISAFITPCCLSLRWKQVLINLLWMVVDHTHFE